MHGPEAIILTGMRRVGKTTVLRRIFENIPSKNALFLDLENPLNRKIFETDNYEAIKAEFETRGLSFADRPTVFLDEIQYCPAIPSVVKYLLDHHGIKFLLTGSASFYLKNLFSESLAGRKYLFELFPLSFEEFIRFKQISFAPSQKITAATHAYIAPLYEEYVRYGGFPGVVAKETSAEKEDSLQDIFTSYFQKEVVEFSGYRKNTAIRDLMLLLGERIGSRISIEKLSAELGISRHTVSEYLSFLEGTYLFSFIRPFSRSRGVEIRLAPKVYAIDTGLARHLGAHDEGHIFENAIFHQLRLSGRTIQYYERRGGAEVDFIVNGTQAYEVKRRADNRDVARLEKVAAELGISGTSVVSYEYADVPNVRYGFTV